MKKYTFKIVNGKVLEDNIKPLSEEEKSANQKLKRFVNNKSEKNEWDFFQILENADRIEDVCKMVIDYASKGAYAAVAEENKAYKRQLKEMESKISDLQNQLGNESVPLSVLAEGLKSYADETTIMEAHHLFNQLNNILYNVPAWMNNVQQLKKFFCDYNKRLNGSVIVQGDYVMTKNIENEVGHVDEGGIGMNVNKDDE